MHSTFGLPSGCLCNRRFSRCGVYRGIIRIVSRLRSTGIFCFGRIFNLYKVDLIRHTASPAFLVDQPRVLQFSEAGDDFFVADLHFLRQFLASKNNVHFVIIVYSAVVLGMLAAVEQERIRDFGREAECIIILVIEQPARPLHKVLRDYFRTFHKRSGIHYFPSLPVEKMCHLQK